MLLLYIILFPSDNFNCFGNLAIYIHVLQVAFRLHKSILPSRLIAFSFLGSPVLRQLQTQVFHPIKMLGHSNTLPRFLYPVQDDLMVDIAIISTEIIKAEMFRGFGLLVSVRIGQLKTTIKKSFQTKAFLHTEEMQNDPLCTSPKKGNLSSFV